MTVIRYPILWQNELVGHIQNPRRWPVLWRGQWIPAGTEATARFLEALSRGRYLWVTVSGDDGREVFATIEQPPQAEIELRFSVDEQETLKLTPDDADDLVSRLRGE